MHSLRASWWCRCSAYLAWMAMAVGCGFETITMAIMVGRENRRAKKSSAMDFRWRQCLSVLVLFLRIFYVETDAVCAASRRLVKAID